MTAACLATAIGQTIVFDEADHGNIETRLNLKSPLMDKYQLFLKNNNISLIPLNAPVSRNRFHTATADSIRSIRLSRQFDCFHCDTTVEDRCGVLREIQ